MFGILANRRIVTGEMMDSPGIAQDVHLQALAGLRRINEVSGVSRRIAQPILGLARAARLQKISLLDVASGGGDVPVAVGRELGRLGMEVDLTFLDRSSTALAQATAAAEQAGLPCNAMQGDALGAPPLDPVDVVTNSLFLHHLHEAGQVVDLLRSMRGLARRMVVISDLRRSPAGYVAAWVGCRLLSRSPIVHYDGPASVRAAWTLGELRTFAAKAGMDGATIHRCSPWRMLLIWKRPPGVNEDEST